MFSTISTISTLNSIISIRNKPSGPVPPNYTNVGVNFSSKSLTPDIYSSIAMSNTGQYILTVVPKGNIFFSNNYGNTWYNQGFKPPSNSSKISGKAIACAINFNGTNLSVTSFDNTNQYIYTSTNSNSTGGPWTTIILGTNKGSSNNSSVSMDSTGQYQVRCGGNIYYSTNYGVNWSLSYYGFSTYDVVYTSNGKIIYATDYDNQQTIHISTNNGVSFYELYNSVAFRFCWANSISTNYNGSIIVTGGGIYGDNNRSNIYISTNSGNTFTTLNLPNTSYLYYISMDNTGKYMLAASDYIYNGNVFYSKNYGVSFALTNLPLNNKYSSVSISPNGKYMAANRSNPSGLFYICANN
jgi:hypothetical protein